MSAVPSSATDRPNAFDGLMGMLQRLQLASAIRLGGTLDQPIDVTTSFAPLSTGLLRMRAKLERPERTVSAATLSTAREAWKDYGPDLTRVGERNVRVLCTDDRTATTPAFIAALHRSRLLSRRRRWLESMIGTYFHAWREMPDPHSMEALLSEGLAGTVARTPRLERLKKNASTLISPAAAAVLGRYVVAKEIPVSTVLDQLGASKTGGLGRCVAEQALGEATTVFLKEGDIGSEDAIVERFMTLVAPLLQDPNVGRDAMGSALERLVPWRRTQELEQYRALIEEIVLSHARLGDPRLLANRGNWTVCPQARDAVVRWMSRRDLAFFFDFVMDQTEDPHGRKTFWSRYIDQVVDSTVALSPHDAYRLRVQVKENISHASVTGTHDVSAFLMRFPASELTIVEFSRPGNALYVHDGRAFDRRVTHGLRAREFDLREDLKGNSMEEAFVHHPTPDWMRKVADFLRRHGIRPQA